MSEVPSRQPQRTGGALRAETLLKKAALQEKQLRQLLQARGPADPSVQQQRAIVRESYEAALIADFECANSHDVLHSLWRLHYKRIEEFRSEIRKLRGLLAKAAQAGSASAGPRGSSSSSEGGGRQPREKEALERQLALFRGFLSEASGFFHNLMGRLKAAHGFTFNHSFPDPPSTEDASSDDAARRAACQQCLVYLGDLVRYRELVDDVAGSRKDWSVAASYYLQATVSLPTHGNPHNQLAVLASYEGNELLAVYRYSRSIAIAAPFDTARTNLLLLLEQNAQKVAQEGLVGAAAPAGAGEQAVAASWAAWTRLFVRIAAVLYTKSSLEGFGPLYLSAMTRLEGALSSPPALFSAAVSSASFSPHLSLPVPLPPASAGGASAGSAALVLVQLTAVLLFAVQACLDPEGSANGAQAAPVAAVLPVAGAASGAARRPPSRGAASGSAGRQGQRAAAPLSFAQVLQRSETARHAVTTFFEVAGRLLRTCASWEPTSSGGSSAAGAGAALPLLPAACVALQWLQTHPEVAATPPSVQAQANGGAAREKTGSTGAASAGGEGRGADRELVARLFFWGQCGALLNRLLHGDGQLLPGDLRRRQTAGEGGEGSGGEDADGGAEGQRGEQALWEDVELRGFLPLAEAQAAMDFSGGGAPAAGGGLRGAAAEPTGRLREQRAVLLGLRLSGWRKAGDGRWEERREGDSRHPLTPLVFSAAQGKFLVDAGRQAAQGPGAGDRPGRKTVGRSGAGEKTHSVAHTGEAISLVPRGEGGVAALAQEGQEQGEGEEQEVDVTGDGPGGPALAAGEEEEEEVPAWAVEELVGCQGGDTDAGDRELAELSARTLEQAALVGGGPAGRHRSQQQGKQRGSEGVEEEVGEEEEEELIVFRPQGSPALPDEGGQAGAQGAADAAGQYLWRPVPLPAEQAAARIAAPHEIAVAVRQAPVGPQEITAVHELLSAAPQAPVPPRPASSSPDRELLTAAAANRSASASPAAHVGVIGGHRGTRAAAGAGEGQPLPLPLGFLSGTEGPHGGLATTGRPPLLSPFQPAIAPGLDHWRGAPQAYSHAASLFAARPATSSAQGSVLSALLGAGVTPSELAALMDHARQQQVGAAVGHAVRPNAEAAHVPMESPLPMLLGQLPLQNSGPLPGVVSMSMALHPQQPSSLRPPHPQFHSSYSAFGGGINGSGEYDSASFE